MVPMRSTVRSLLLTYLAIAGAALSGGCASPAVNPPSKPFLLQAQSEKPLPISDARPAERRRTRSTPDGFLAGDELLSTQPPVYTASALSSAIADHEWRNVIAAWLPGKRIELRSFDVLVDKGQLSVPWQSTYGLLPPGQAAVHHAMLSIVTEWRRSQRVAVNLELAIDGDVFSGVGYGPYLSVEQTQAVAGPAAEAVRQVAAELAEAAAGIRSTKRTN
jgi:hypothetical protein